MDKRKKRHNLGAAWTGQETFANRGKNMMFDARIDYLRRKVEAALNAEANTGQGIEHVKDGKPLTATGAKLLGVEWNDD